MRRRVRALLCAALVLFGAAGAARPAAARPPVWVVRDRDSELVLFGSVHLLPPGLDWRPPALTRAIARADDLWFELPIDPQSEAETAALAGRVSFLPPGQSLTAMLPPEDAQRLVRVVGAYGADLGLIDRLQPWMAEVALGAAAYRRAGAAGDQGVEKSLSVQAPASAKRRAFETPAEQVQILAGAPVPDQIASLLQTLEEMEDEPDDYAQLVRAWMAGDLKTLDREALQPLRAASPALFRRLLTERNARWTLVLDARLKGRGRTVVVVGMGHLIGPDGLPARLRALGYRVQGP